MWERESMSGEEREKQAVCWAGSLTQGSIPGPWDHDLSQRQMLNQLSHPGAPSVNSLSLREFLTTSKGRWTRLNRMTILEPKCDFAGGSRCREFKRNPFPNFFPHLCLPRSMLVREVYVFSHPSWNSLPLYGRETDYSHTLQSTPGSMNLWDIK